MSESALWISEVDVVSMMDMQEAVAALEKGLMLEADGDAQNMAKTHVEWGDGATLHAIGATFPKVGFAGTKTWSHTKGGATPLLIVFDSNTGALKAVIEAFALGQMRTAAASGVATRWLAVPEASEFAILGAGKQAITQVAAVLAVRPVRRVRVFCRNEERRNQFAVRVKAEFGVEAVAAQNVSEAVKGAEIITVATRATTPILSADMIQPGAHINAIGALVPSRAELTADVIGRSTQIVVDSIPQAQNLSRELIEYFGSDTAKWGRVRSLASVVSNRLGRTVTDDLTLFKSLGTGISDLSLGIELFRKAVETGLGHSFPHPKKVAPRLRFAQPSLSKSGG
jgi:ornithine cyclodeaminase